MISSELIHEASDALHTVRDCLRFGESRLRAGDIFLGHGTDDPWDEAALDEGTPLAAGCRPQNS